MQPIVIYAMPRTYSNLWLSRVKRPEKYCEPFSRRTLFPLAEWHPFWPQQMMSISGELDDLFDCLDKPDTAVKFFGSHLHYCLKAREWWSRVQDQQTHRIFITQRPLQDQLLSNLIARVWGFSKNTERPPEKTLIDLEFFRGLNLELDSFLRWFPKTAEPLTLDGATPDCFESTGGPEPQHTLQKLDYIENLDECREKIDQLVDYYKKDCESAWQSIGLAHP
jgi:hypothetical protein